MTVSIFTIHSIALVKYLREVKYQRGSQVFIRPTGAVQSSVACTLIWSYHNSPFWPLSVLSMVRYVPNSRGLPGGFLLLQNFSVAISVSPLVCFIIVLILISMSLR